MLLVAAELRRKLGNLGLESARRHTANTGLSNRGQTAQTSPHSMPALALQGTVCYAPLLLGPAGCLFPSLLRCKHTMHYSAGQLASKGPPPRGPPTSTASLVATTPSKQALLRPLSLCQCQQQQLSMND
jgi:hypothetical protein